MNRIRIRQAHLEDVQSILAIEDKVWPLGLRATSDQFISRIETFPRGTYVAETSSYAIIGVVSTLIVNYELRNPVLSWSEITDKGFIKNTHNPSGDTLYGVDLSVSSSTRNTSKLLMEQVGRLVISLNLKRGILGSRIPRFCKFADKMTAQEYVDSRSNGHQIDPELVFYSRLGLRVGGVISDYIDDPESCNYGVLLVWDNPFYGKPFPKLFSRLFKVK